MAAVGTITMKQMTSNAAGQPEETEEIEENIVWVGDIDGLPVIGTVREGVALVLAAAKGDLDLAKKIHLKIISDLISQDCTDVCTDSLDIEGIPEKYFITCMVKKTSQGSGKKGESASKEQDKTTLEKEIERVKETLKQIGMELDTTKIKVTKDRSKRGEHVFNNDLLKLHKKIKKNASSYTPESSYNSDALQYFIPKLNPETPLSKEHKKCIESEMVAIIDNDELYINSNSTVYGAYMKALHDTIKKNFQIYQKLSDPLEDLYRIVTAANDREVYVDPFAKEKWIQNKQKEKEKFEEVKSAVATMFVNLYNMVRDARVS
ncbi:hypothetical protein GN956_G14196 [Arapaima gigas]